MRGFWIGVGMAAALCGARADNLARVPQRDPAMNAAFAKAAASFDQFLAQWRRPPAGYSQFAVKVGIVAAPGSPGFRIVRPGTGNGEAVEYFWIGDLKETPQGFEGAIANEPEDVPAARRGSRVAFQRADVADWTYFQNGKIIGNATACPALAHASQEERDEMRERYGLACD